MTQESTSSEQDPGEKEWWDDPGMPWRHKPSRADIVCLVALGVVGIYGLLMLPLRPVMLTLAPHLLGSLGYRTGVVMTGALASMGDPWWPLVWLLGSLATIKFSWIYWWAGRLWGREIFNVMAKGKSERTRRRWDQVWKLTHSYEVVAMVATFLPLPLPAGIIYAALGAAGTSLRKFLIVCGVSSLVTTGIYMLVGWRIGEPAVALMDTYGRYLWYVSIAIILGMVAVAAWRGRRPHQAATSRD